MTAPRQPLSKRLRVVISVVLIAHLLAVALPPLSFQARGPLGPSPSIATLFTPLEGYAQFLYIDRGYAFFAPDPGPSHLIQVAVTEGNGERVETLYPNLQNQWPRLLYHRHFMLTEFLYDAYQPPGPPPELVELDPVEAAAWARSRLRYEHLRQSIIDHLEHVNPGREVAIRRIEHMIPDLVEFQREPIALNDPRLYRVLLDTPIEMEQPGEVPTPAGPPESVPLPEGAVSDGSDAEPATPEQVADRESDGRQNDGRQNDDLGPPAGATDDDSGRLPSGQPASEPSGEVSDPQPVDQGASR